MLDEHAADVENLEKHFPITRGIIFQKEIGRVRAVDGVSFASTRARRWAWWGSRAAASRRWPAA